LDSTHPPPVIKPPDADERPPDPSPSEVRGPREIYRNVWT
jgi:hypothetical protein